MDPTGLTRCAECNQDLKDLQKHLIDSHGFPDTAIEEIGTMTAVAYSSNNKSKLKHKKKDNRDHHQLTLTTPDIRKGSNLF
jgi:hypothetical protein